MKSKLTLLFTIFLLWGCSPKYKIVYDFTPPSDYNSKQCIKKCYNDQKSCRSLCDTKKEKCYQNAVIEAKKEYQEELRIYHQKYRTYKLKLQEYLAQKKKKEDLQERIFYYSDVCETKKDRYACEKKNEYKYQLNRLSYLSKPIEPKEPRYNVIIADKKSALCSSVCDCDKIFRTCYISCGGIVTSKKICIANCPDD